MPPHEQQCLGKVPRKALQSQPQLPTPQPAPACEHQSAHGQTQLQQAREVPPPVAADRARQAAPQAKAAGERSATPCGGSSSTAGGRGCCMSCGSPGGAINVLEVEKNQLCEYFTSHILQTGPYWLNTKCEEDMGVLVCGKCHAEYRGQPAALRRQADDSEEEAEFQRAIEASLALEQPGAAEEQPAALRRQEDDIEEEAAFQRAIEASLALEQPGAAEELDQEEALRRT